MNPIDFRGQRSRSQWTYYGSKLVNTIETKALTVVYFFIKLVRHVKHGERMYPIGFGGQGSKVKVTMGIYGNKLVDTIVTKPLGAS